MGSVILGSSHHADVCAQVLINMIGLLLISYSMLNGISKSLLHRLWLQMMSPVQDGSARIWDILTSVCTVGRRGAAASIFVNVNGLYPPSEAALSPCLKESTFPHPPQSQQCKHSSDPGRAILKWVKYTHKKLPRSKCSQCTYSRLGPALLRFRLTM